MSVQAGTGASLERDPRIAAKEAVEAAKEMAGIDVPDLVVLHATVAYDQPALLKAAREAAGGGRLIGCSGEGTICESGCVEERYSVSAMVVKSDTLRFDLARAHGLKENSRHVGAAIADQLLAKRADDNLALLVMTDGLTLHWDSFYEGISALVDGEKHLPLIGGSSGDSWEFIETYQYFDDDVLSDSAVSLLISGEGQFASFVTHGCAAAGRRRTITKAEGNTIYEIDGKPAVDVVREYVSDEEMEDWANVLTYFCVGLPVPAGLESIHDRCVIRHIPGGPDEQGAISLRTNVKEGDPLWVIRRDKERLVHDLATSSEELKRQIGDKKPQLVFHIDCSGRGKTILTPNQKKDLLQQVRERVSTTAPWIGFYSYGEIGPVNGKNFYHEFTAIIGAIY